MPSSPSPTSLTQRIACRADKHGNRKRGGSKSGRSSSSSSSDSESGSQKSKKTSNGKRIQDAMLGAGESSERAIS